MATRRTFQVRCKDRIAAVSTKDDLEEMGFLVEPPCECIKRQSRHQPHKKAAGEVILVVNVPPDVKDDTPEMHIFESYADEFAFNHPNQVLWA